MLETTAREATSACLCRLASTTPMIARLDTKEWLRIIAESATEVATVALGFETAEIRAQSTAAPDGLIGAYLPLGTNEQPMQVGFLADPAGCQVLAKALLGMSAEDEDL